MLVPPAAGPVDGWSAEARGVCSYVKVRLLSEKSSAFGLTRSGTWPGSTEPGAWQRTDDASTSVPGTTT